MTARVLFVCLGNICRSPTAEGVFRQRAHAAGLAVEADSAGTGAWHLGKPPYGPAIAAARARGYEIGDLRARQVARADFARFDLILAMDEDNHVDLARLCPPEARARLRYFLDYAPETGEYEVPDPYYTGDFDTALDLIEAAATGLVADLARRGA